VADNLTARDDSNGPTQWAAIWLLFFAGCTVTLHIGKAPPALPILRESWQLSLTQTGYIVSMYSLLIATTGLLLGLLVKRAGYCTFAVMGVAVVGVGSILGTQATSLPWLLVSRAIEGFGWIVTVVAVPSLFTALSQPLDRPLVMGIWSAFVPVGAGIMLLLAPLFHAYGSWQLSWWFAGLVSLLAALGVVHITQQYPKRFAHLRAAHSSLDFSDLRKPQVWLLSGCFLAYSFQFLAVTSFLPTLFIETTDIELPTASRLVAVVIMSNAIGNVAAGYLIRKGMDYLPLLVVGALSMGVLALIVFSASAAAPVRLLCAVGFAVVGGIIPGVLFITLPKSASCGASVGLLVGLMMQCSGMGQFLGGISVPAAVEFFDTWQAAGFVALSAGVGGSGLALLTRYTRVCPDSE